jgi:hypothetical protein
MIISILNHPDVKYASINCFKGSHANVVVQYSGGYLKEESLGPDCQKNIEKLVDKVLKQLNNEFISDEDLI